MLQVEYLQYDWNALMITSLQKIKAFFTICMNKMYQVANSTFQITVMESKDVGIAA